MNCPSNLAARTWLRGRPMTLRELVVPLLVWLDGFFADEDATWAYLLLALRAGAAFAQPASATFA